MHEEVRIAQAHLLIDTHAAKVGVDAKVLAGGVATPHETRAAPRIQRRRAELRRQPLAARTTRTQVFHCHAGKYLLAQRQLGQVHPRGEIGGLQRIRADDPAWVGKAVGGVPLQHHAGGLVAARPDDAARMQAPATRTVCVVIIQRVVFLKATTPHRHDGGVAQLQAIGHLRPHALRSHQRGRADAGSSGQAHVRRRLLEEQAAAGTTVGRGNQG